MTIKALVFDLGNVVIDIDFELIFKKWSHYSGVPVDKMKSTFQVDHAYQQHERGEIEGADYHQHLERVLGMNLTYDQFCEGWNDIMVAPIDETVRVLETLKGRVPLYALSNANTLHKQHWEKTYPDALAHFDKVFVSSDIGRRKPEPDAYHHVFDDLGVVAQDVVFFDDLAENIHAARALGMQAIQVYSPKDVETFISANF